MSKFHDLFISRRFWVAIAGVVFVLTDYFGLSLTQEQVEAIFFLIVTWIVGDSIRSTDHQPGRRDTLRSITIFVVFGSCVATSSQAQEIAAPESVDAYHLVQIHVVGDEYDGFAWIVRRLPDGMRPELIRVDGGRLAVWTGPPGKYDVDLICQKDGSLCQAHTQITILAPKPPDPPPDPDPRPLPDDDDQIPEDEFGNLGRKVYKLASMNATPAFPFAKLAALYMEVADRLEGISDPIVPTISAASEAILKGQTEILSTAEADAWLRSRAEIGKVWDEYKQSMDRTKAARFYRAVGRGLQALGN